MSALPASGAPPAIAPKANREDKIVIKEESLYAWLILAKCPPTTCPNSWAITPAIWSRVFTLIKSSVVKKNLGPGITEALI